MEHDKKMTRSRDCMIAGVCAGMSELVMPPPERGKFDLNDFRAP